jgi:hypothetical protein
VSACLLVEKNFIGSEGAMAIARYMPQLTLLKIGNVDLTIKTSIILVAMQSDISLGVVYN